MTSATNHNNDFDDELLSAYVDGEVTAEERAVVEARLRTEPQAVQLVEELRSLSSAIKLLPRESLPRDLRVGIHAEIERAKSVSDDGLPPLPYHRWTGIRRGLFWSAAAIAATLAMVVLTPEETDRDREVAKAEAKQATDAEKTEVAANKSKSTALPGMSGSMKALPAPAEVDQPRAMGGAMPAPSEPASGPAAGEDTRRALSDLKPEDGVNRGMDRSDANGVAAGSPANAPQPGSAAAPSGAVLDAFARNGSEKVSEDALAGAQAPAGARELYNASVGAPEMIELAVKSPAGMKRFEQLLERYDIPLVEQNESSLAATAEGPKAAFKEKKQTEEHEALAEDVKTDAASAPAALNEPAVDSDAKFGEVFKDRASTSLGLDDATEERVVVEASPAQIHDLYFACLAEKDSFAAAAPLNDEAKVERGPALASGSAATTGASGGFGGGGGAPPRLEGSSNSRQAAAAKRSDLGDLSRKGGEESRARAWRLRSFEYEYAQSAQKSEGGELKQKLAETPKPPLAAAEAPAKAKSDSGDLARRSLSSSTRDKLAKTPQDAEAQKIQVLFVLRRLPAASGGETASSSPTAPDESEKISPAEAASPAPAAEPAPAQAKP